jgi:hypothetical protein
MFEQDPPELLQSCHWYVKLVGLPDHDPGVELSALPCLAVPETCGRPVFAGALGDELATMPVWFEVALVEPPELVAVTFALIV